MSHIGNKIRAGFFATPVKQGEYITKLLNVKGEGAFLDPTCGEGEILKQLSSSFQSEDCTITTYGVELDKTRAKTAQENLDHCINAPIESMVISNEAVSLLFLNPPYDHTMKGMDDDNTDRKEWTELVRNVRYLKERGLMIYIIPSYRFADKKIARYLATHFSNIGVVRFSDEEYDDFKQCIFIGNKKSGKHKEFNQKLYDFLLNMESEDFVRNQVTPVNVMVGKHQWDVPTGPTELKTFYTKLENKSNFYEGIKNSKGFSAFMERSKPKQLVIGGNPCLPINQGQMALLLASGAVNGEIGTDDHYHLVQGLEIVSKVTEEEERRHDNGSKTTITKERTKRDVSVKVITPKGLVRKLV
ncbi:SAM-dependent methyltransferase [Aquibacillus sp. 3ASR75-11]|uniref:SAM-dependent methyltransferase n=1 Tax=Terrihalobacillus insolitus TaxID=2950438 RepID=A0A9X3WUB0_9BACI|nr:DUF6094 domain-containing protein [Terrihalobacillus insolitus]MDC3424371.1 SAM-dependent methyltransferase [Terrihalobacillus insolitus]